jgi:hypothetical protein
MKRYLGVDLHRKQFTVCTRLESGRTYLRQWPMRDLKIFAAQLRNEDELAVESTGNTRLFYFCVVGDFVAQDEERPVRPGCWPLKGHITFHSRDLTIQGRWENASRLSDLANPQFLSGPAVSRRASHSFFYFFQKSSHSTQFRNFAAAEPHCCQPNPWQHDHNHHYQYKAGSGVGDELELDCHPIHCRKPCAKNEPPN